MPAIDPIVDATRRLLVLGARHRRNLPMTMADDFLDQSAGSDDDARWCEVQAALLQTRGPDQLGYLSAISVYSQERLLGSDHPCGHRLLAVTCALPSVGGYRRDVWFCERCGIVADLPAGVHAPALQDSGDGCFEVTGAPWDRWWMTSGVSPLGFSAGSSTTPTLVQGSSARVEAPPGSTGRRVAVVLVGEGEHVIVQVPAPEATTRGVA